MANATNKEPYILLEAKGLSSRHGGQVVTVAGDRAQRDGEIRTARLTREQQLQDKVDFLQAEVDRLRTLNFQRGARLAAVRKALRSWVSGHLVVSEFQAALARALVSGR